jgi:glutaredoxin
VKEFLSRAGRHFVERNVDEDDAAYRDLLGLGFRTVPVTVIGNHHIKGYHPHELQAALKEIDAR